MASFAQLSLIIIAGLCGPLLASSRRLLIPVVVGELLGGVVLGKTGAGLIKADDPTIAFLGNIGFAVLMMVAGMHVPLRNRALVGSLRVAIVAVLITAGLGAVGGVAIGEALGLGHPAVWAILLATGSAAIVLPALQEAGVSDERAIPAMAWATVADVSTIVAVPLVLDPSKAVRAGLGALAVAGGAVVVLFAGRVLAHGGEVHNLRRQSAEKAWALDLRVALLALFGLAALAEWVGTSIMIAGFAAGLVVAWEGGPHRLSDQVNGVANGLLVPIFFVVLGASLNVRALVSEPSRPRARRDADRRHGRRSRARGAADPLTHLDRLDRDRAARGAGGDREARPCPGRVTAGAGRCDHRRRAREPRRVRDRHRDREAWHARHDTADPACIDGQVRCQPMIGEEGFVGGTLGSETTSKPPRSPARRVRSG